MAFLSHISPVTLRKMIQGLFFEFSPVVLFLIVYFLIDMIIATYVLVISTIISTIFVYHREQRLPYAALYVALITTVFGYMTIHFRNPEFIQIRDTLYDLTLAGTLLLGFVWRVNFFKIAFHSIVPMTTRAWNSIASVWVWFFLLLAVTNEYMRQTFPVEAWMLYKISVVLVTVVFGFVVFAKYYEQEKGVL